MLNATHSNLTAAARVGLPTRELLTFRLGEEEYALDILAVQEIRCHEPPTRLAGSPHDVAGVINLRGAIVPVVDLRLRLELQATVGASTVTIVLNVGESTVGAIVDAVSDVVELAVDAVRPPPEFSTAVDACYITGIGVTTQGDRERMLLILDVSGLMSGIAGIVNSNLLQ